MDSIELDIILYWLNDRRVLVLNFFWLLIPTMTMWFIDDWFGLLSSEVRIVLRRAKTLLLFALIPYGYYHVTYTWGFPPNSTEWKIHLLASLFDLLFVIMVVFSYRESFNIKRCIFTSYCGISMSFFTLFAESIPELATAASVIFMGGILIFLFGLTVIGVKYRNEWLHLQSFNEEALQL